MVKNPTRTADTIDIQHSRAWRMPQTLLHPTVQIKALSLSIGIFQPTTKTIILVAAGGANPTFI